MWDSASMIYGVISLMGAQFLAVVFGVIVYIRQQATADGEKRERGILGPRVDEALRKASDALLGVERIDVEQYRALAKKLAEAYGEIEMLKARVLAQEESIKSLSNKLASRDRADKRADKSEEGVPSAKAEKGVIQADILEELRAQGLAVPLANVDGAPQTNHRPPGFGRSLKGA